MNKFLFEKLSSKSQGIRSAILEVCKNKCKNDFNSVLKYLETAEISLPDNIVELGKGNVNICLHNTSFNNIPHFHNFFEIIYVYKGELTNDIYGDIITIKENECIIQYPGIKHTVLRTSEKSIILNVIINKDFFNFSYNKVIFDSRYFLIDDKSNNRKYIVCKNLKKIVKKLIDILIELFLYNEEYSQISFENLLILLLIEMLKSNGEVNTDGFTTKLYSYINQNIQNISLENTASYFGYHPKYFSCLVKNKIGKSFKDIVIEKKIEKAAYHLIYTDYSNSKITELIGYENNLSFYNNFKNIFNCSPNDYRKKKKES